MKKDEMFIYEKNLNYLKEKEKIYSLVSILDLPILIVLWVLNFKVGFWIVLSLIIINGIGFASWVAKQRKRLDLQ